MEAPIEKFSVYHLSPKAKVVIKEGSRMVTIIKRVKVNAMMQQEIQLRMNADELAMLFHVLNMRTLTDDAIKAMTKPNDTEKGGDHADNE